MKTRLLFCLCFAVIFSDVRAADRAPSRESIQEMIEVTEVRKLMDSMYAQLDPMMKSMMQQALRGRKATPAMEKAMSRFAEKWVALMREEMNWEKMQSFYVEVYQKTFTQDEIDGMLTFYKSKAGQAMVKKMPLLMQEVMGSMQGMMGSMVEKLQRLGKELDAEMRAEIDRQ